MSMGSTLVRVGRKRVRVRTPVGEKSMTKQEFAKDADINAIVGKYLRTGILVGKYEAGSQMYGDFTQVPDYATMHERVEGAKAMFMALPADLRNEFDNDPGRFLKAAGSPELQKRMERLGLLRKADPKPSNEATDATVKKTEEAKK